MQNYQLVKCLRCNAIYAVEFKHSYKIGQTEEQKTDFYYELGFFIVSFLVCITSILNIYLEPDWLKEASEMAKIILFMLFLLASVLCIPALIFRFFTYLCKVTDIEVLDKQQELLKHPNYNDQPQELLRAYYREFWKNK